MNARATMRGKKKSINATQALGRSKYNGARYPQRDRDCALTYAVFVMSSGDDSQKRADGGPGQLASDLSTAVGFRTDSIALPERNAPKQISR